MKPKTTATTVSLNPEFFKMFMDEWFASHPLICPDCKKPIPIPQLVIKK